MSCSAGSLTVDYALMSRRSEKTTAIEASAFAVPRPLVARIIAIATGGDEASTPVGRPAHVRYLDTFDRRLRRTGLVLEHITLPGETGLRYRELGRAERLVEAPGAAVPAFADDVSHSRLRSLLSSLIDVRRLLVVAETRARLAVIRGRDREDKTVLVVECFTARRGPARLTVHPLRGYERFARRAIRRLREVEGIVPDDDEPMLTASDGPDAIYGGLAKPPRAHVHPDERSDAACKRLLAGLDAVLEMNAPAIEADLDPECLHDFRVAVRKSRSLLREMKRVFPPTVTRRLRADLGWLGQCTGPLRDLDVHLLELGSAAVLDGEGAQGNAAAVLRSHLETLREREYRALCRTLRSARLRRVRSTFRKFLESEPPTRPRSENALTPIAALSAARILEAYRRILAEGRAIGEDSPAESLHELRKSCKRLRYLLEFFRDIHPAKPVQRTIARLKRLQDNLGAYQDIQVQRLALGDFRDRIRASFDEAGLRAIDGRCEALAEREWKIRADFATRFARYDSKRAHKRFAAALGRTSR